MRERLTARCTGLETGYLLRISAIRVSGSVRRPVWSRHQVEQGEDVEFARLRGRDGGELCPQPTLLRLEVGACVMCHEANHLRGSALGPRNAAPSRACRPVVDSSSA